jgi:hypothetical protein
MPAVRQQLKDAPATVNAKAVHLQNVPAHEQWYAMTSSSTNDNLILASISSPHLGWQALLAAGLAGGPLCSWVM